MSEESSILSTPGSPARGVGNLASFLRRYGAAVTLAVSLGSPTLYYYLSHSFATKDALEDVRHLVYDRTRPISERVGSVENRLTGIETKLDAASKLQDERAHRQENDAAEIKSDLREIRQALLAPHNGADVRTTR